MVFVKRKLLLRMAIMKSFSSSRCAIIFAIKDNKYLEIRYLIGGDPNKRQVDRISLIVDEINNLEPDYEVLSDEALRHKTAEFRSRLAEGESMDDLMSEAFAVVREASKRTIGMRHFVQLIGGTVLLGRSPRCAPVKANSGRHPADLPESTGRPVCT
jgi:hypothetical protein